MTGHYYSELGLNMFEKVKVSFSFSPSFIVNEVVSCVCAVF